MLFQFISDIHQASLLLLFFHKAYPRFCAPAREYFQLHSDLEGQGWGTSGCSGNGGRWYKSGRLDVQVFGKRKL